MMRVLFLCVGCLFPVLVLAQTSDFNINTFVGSDTEAPTTPSIVSATPVSPNQIDIVWGPVTDNFAVGGYRVYRDGLQIATTSLVTFSDTGLGASTTYTYTIEAFDYFYNISSSSTPVATTTLPIPIVPVATSTPTTTAPAEATMVPSLRSLVVTPSQLGATLTFASYGPSRYMIRFGRTDAYELGSVSTNVFKTEHNAVLTGLEPGTTYFFEVTLINGFGVERVVRRESFTTLPAVISSVPVSASMLVGEVVGRDALLSWKNPEDFASIRVVRSHLFYPTDIYDGVTVYQGRGDQFVDKNVFIDADTVYYAVFVVMADGRVAAPAVLRLKRQTLPDTALREGTSSQPDRLPPLPDVTLTPQYEGALLPSDIFFTIGHETKTFDTLRTILTNEQVLISIPANAVPAGLKTILVTVFNPTNNNETTTYLLKLRGDGGAYEASFPAGAVVGEGRIMIELYDYDRVVVRRLSKAVVYEAADGTSSESLLLWWWSIVPLLILAYFVRSWWLAMRREDNQ